MVENQQSEPSEGLVPATLSGTNQILAPALSPTDPNTGALEGVGPGTNSIVNGLLPSTAGDDLGKTVDNLLGSLGAGGTGLGDTVNGLLASLGLAPDPSRRADEQMKAAVASALAKLVEAAAAAKAKVEAES
ncbi:hypothetical protein ACODT5_09605 [Streptomyces sp. 5.8]|uniref:hypothetical protein n=1 Tax=Streptomyces sp. 5.8 TaxID=3406571 RepID=UPI003BB61704